MSISNVNNINNNNSATSAKLKYGDADVCSKRRKLAVIPESMQSTDEDSDYHSNDIFTEINSDCDADDDEDDNKAYVSFERKIAGASNLNSSTCDDDFKGNLLSLMSTGSSPSLSSNSTTLSSLNITSIIKSSIINENADQETCAKNPKTITTKPSVTSKGFENSFKLLQRQVGNNCQKSYSLLCQLSETPNSSLTSIVSGEQEPLTRFELEFEAMQRMRNMLLSMNKNAAPESRPIDLTIPRPFLTLLHDFTVKNFTTDEESSQNPTTATNETLDSDCGSKNVMYHVARDVDGNTCLKIVRSLLTNKVLCGNRVSQMTRAYDDIEAVTRLLEEKEKDLELTVQIGKELLTQNNTLENRISDLESDLKTANEDRAQLVHELHKKNELIAVLTNDADEGNENDTPTLSKSITLDLLQKKIASLQDENRSLKIEASQLACQTDEVEAHERQLMEDISAQLNEANSQYDGLSLELERQREENRLQHEQIVNLTARLAEAEMRLHQLTTDNEERRSLLDITQKNQNSLALELVEFKQRYQEVLALLQEAQDQLRLQRKKTQPQARSSFIGSFGTSSLLQPESLQSELMESSLYSENSLDSGIAGDYARANDRIGRLMSQVPGVYGGSSMVGGLAGGAIPPYKRVFDTVRCAGKYGNYNDSGHVSMSQLGAMSMSSTSGPRMSSMANPAGSYYRESSNSPNAKTLSCESLSAKSDDSYPAQPTGVPGAPGAKELEAALKRLTPAEVLARRAMLSYAPVGTYNYDEPTQGPQPHGIRTPDSIMSTGSSGISASSVHLSASMHQWRLPEKLQIVKPMEGSQTLHHWSRLATPTLSGLLEERPGVTIRGGRCLDELGMQLYTLSDVEEDVSDDLPGKQFEAPGCTYTYTTSMVMHPDDGFVNDLSFLSQSQMSSRMASTSTSRQPSCPPTPRAGLSRKNSCSTFSVNLGLASMLNERGIKAVTPSALNTPAGPNYSPTVTPCNSPEGSPTRSMSPEPLFGLLSSGADLIRRKLVGGDIERPTRNQLQTKQQKIMLSRLERRALRSLKLVEKVESIGLENIITTQPSAMSQLASGIANRSTSPMAQLTSLKHIHTSSNSIVDDIHFDRAQIKGVLHKGLTSPSPSTAASFCCSEPDNYSDSDDFTYGSARSIINKNSTTSATTATGTKTKTTNTSSVAQQQHQQRQQQQHAMQVAGAATATAATTTVAAAAAASDTRIKQMQRQKSRRSLKNGIAAQRPDLGTITGGGVSGGRVRTDLGKVGASAQQQDRQRGGASMGAIPRNSKANARSPDSSTSTSTATRESSQQSITQAFVGSSNYQNTYTLAAITI